MRGEELGAPGSTSGDGEEAAPRPGPGRGYAGLKAKVSKFGFDLQH